MFSIFCKCCELNQKEDFDIVQTELKIDKMLRGERVKKINKANEIKYTSESKIYNNYSHLLNTNSKENLNTITKSNNKDSEDKTVRKKSSVYSNHKDFINSLENIKIYDNNNSFKYQNLTNDEYYIEFSNEKSTKNSNLTMDIDSSLGVNNKYIRKDEINLRFTKRGIINEFYKVKNIYFDPASVFFYQKEFNLKYSIKEENDFKKSTLKVDFIVKNNKEELFNKLSDYFLNINLRLAWDKSIKNITLIESNLNYSIISVDYYNNNSIVTSLLKQIYFQIGNRKYLFFSSINNMSIDVSAFIFHEFIFFEINNNTNYITLEIYDKTGKVHCFLDSNDILRNYSLLHKQLEIIS